VARDTQKYEALASVLPLSSADRVVDVGCGTGRSLVGLVPAVGDAATVVALDVFDDRVILGNGPELARRNAAAAGHRVAPVRGDAATLPVASDSVDVVTACRVLHDLPETDARAALDEARRALAPDGTLGVLELPIPHDEGVDPAEYWPDLIADAGFTVSEQRTLDDEYFLVVARPDG
jgi:ubiquinone/menaquinone biosynthesis C-methylase UbiE